jgi:hypothetical protein
MISLAIHISARDRLCERHAKSFHRPVKSDHPSAEVTDSSRVVANTAAGTNGGLDAPRI